VNTSAKHRLKQMPKETTRMNVSPPAPISTSVVQFLCFLVVNVLQTQASAIRMLQSRIETIKQYLVDVDQVLAHYDFVDSRQNSTRRTDVEGDFIDAVSSTSSFITEFAEQFEDSWGGVLLTSLYTEILKGAGNMQEVFDLPTLHPPSLLSLDIHISRFVHLVGRWFQMVN